MHLYDDQRMATCMGLPRVMEQLGLLTPLRGRPQASQNVVMLGHSSPPLAYRLSFNKTILAHVIAQCADTTLPQELTTAALKHHLATLTTVFQHWPVARVKLKHTQVTKRLRFCRKKIADTELTVIRHFFRKHISWLMSDRQLR